MLAAAIWSSSGRYGTAAMIRAEHVLDAAGERLQLGRLLDDLGHLDELADQIRLVLDPPFEPDAADALDEDPQRSVGDADQLVDDGGGPDLVEVVPAGRLDVLVLDATSATIRSPLATSSTSLIERSWPIASGVIDCGKTTVSFSGRTGRIGGTSTLVSARGRTRAR